MIRAARYPFEQYDHVVDKAKEKMSFYFSQQIVPETLPEGPKADLEMMYKIQREAMALAWHGMYDYDRSPRLDDGDQTSLRGNRTAKYLWGVAMDWHPKIGYLSPFTKCLLLGDYNKMIELIGDKTGEELRALLEYRETYFRVPALFHVVRGLMARYNRESLSAWGVKEPSYSYGACFMKLLELGANIQAKDFLGANLLFHCVRRWGTWGKGQPLCPETQILAEILIKRGLDVNSTNRLGETALGIAIMNRDLDAIKLFLSHNIDLGIKDGDGWSAQQMAMGDMRIQKLISQQSLLVAERKKREKQKLKEDFVAAVAERSRQDDCTAGGGSPIPKLKKLFHGVLSSLGLNWNKDKEELVTDQGESSTCTIHALAKAAKQSLAEQSLNIDLENCLANFLNHPDVSEEEGNHPEEFHCAKISSVTEENLNWPGSVELVIKRVANTKKFNDKNLPLSKDTKLVLVYNDSEAGLHSVFISGIEKVDGESNFAIVNSWGPPRPGDATHVRVRQEQNMVYEVRARWSPDGCETVCKVFNQSYLFLLHFIFSTTSGLLCSR